MLGKVCQVSLRSLSRGLMADWVGLPMSLLLTHRDNIMVFGWACGSGVSDQMDLSNNL